MIWKLGIQHLGPKTYKVYINDDPRLTLTYFTTRSNSGKIAHCLLPDPDVRRTFKGPLQVITKTSPCYEHPLTPHFYIVKVIEKQ